MSVADVADQVKALGLPTKCDELLLWSGVDDQGLHVRLCEFPLSVARRQSINHAPCADVRSVGIRVID